MLVHECLIVNLKGKHRKDTLEGRPHLVVPCTMLKDDMVIEGSKGPILYPGIENKKSVPAWDHMPIVVDHPKSGSKFVSARSKQWIDARKVGIILNTAHDGKLVTECWFDEARTKQIDKRVYDAIVNDQPMETSTGLGAEVEWNKGRQNGKAYKGIARDYKPDHLAILPDAIGALSVAAGGGLFANMATMPEGTQTVLSRSAEKLLNQIKVEMLNNELSFSQTTSQLSDLLAAKLGQPGKYWSGYICEVYGDRVIFRDYPSTPGYDGPRDQLYLIEYTVEDDTVALKGDPKQVERVVRYETVDNEVLVSNEAGDLVPTAEIVPPVPTKESDMAFDKKAHVSALITNGVIEESQRATFEALPDATVQAMKVPAKPATPPTPEVKAEPVVANAAPATAKMSREEVVALLGPEFMEVHNQGQEALKTSKARYIEVIKANPNNKFSDEMLANMKLPQLAAMAELARTTTPTPADTGFVDGWHPDFSGMAAPAPGVIGNQAAGGKKKGPPEGEKGGLKLPRMTFVTNEATAK